MSESNGKFPDLKKGPADPKLHWEVVIAGVVLISLDCTPQGFVIDGEFGDMMEAGVMALQLRVNKKVGRTKKGKKIAVTGELDAETREALKIHYGIDLDSIPPVPGVISVVPPSGQDIVH
ncbi:MAG: peptidoglycan-binding protein [Candidatus Liptonbacteria bacterium]|nr:peptidoglycan-binding protein [Candidatus Liptonbacteria bacterium]MBI3114507.1 peptidoglycan-binding protein [Candidatus Harrisonbacteria bacterium]